MSYFLKCPSCKSIDIDDVTCIRLSKNQDWSFTGYCSNTDCPKKHELLDLILEVTNG